MGSTSQHVPATDQLEQPSQSGSELQSQTAVGVTNAAPSAAQPKRSRKPFPMRFRIKKPTRSSADTAVVQQSAITEAADTVSSSAEQSTVSHTASAVIDAPATGSTSLMNAELPAADNATPTISTDTAQIASQQALDTQTTPSLAEQITQLSTAINNQPAELATDSLSRSQSDDIDLLAYNDTDTAASELQQSVTALSRASHAAPKSYTRLILEHLNEHGQSNGWELHAAVSKQRAISADDFRSRLNRIIDDKYVSMTEMQVPIRGRPGVAVGYAITDAGKQYLESLQSTLNAASDIRGRTANERRLNAHRSNIAQLHTQMQQSKLQQQTTPTSDDEPIVKRFSDDLPVSHVYGTPQQHTSSTTVTMATVVDTPVPTDKPTNKRKSAPARKRTYTKKQKSVTTFDDAVKPQSTTDTTVVKHEYTNGSNHTSSSTDAQQSNTAALFDAISEDLKCSICMDLMIDACAISCSHTFCSLCISQWRVEQAKSQDNDANKLTCPVCRAVCDPPMKVNALNNIIDKLIISLSQSEQKERTKRIKTNKTKQKRIDGQINKAVKQQQRQQYQHQHLHQLQYAVPPRRRGHGMPSLVNTIRDMIGLNSGYDSRDDDDYDSSDAERDNQLTRQMLRSSHTHSRAQHQYVELIDNIDEPILIDESDDDEYENADSMIYSVSKHTARNTAQCVQCIKPDHAIQRGQLRVVGRLPNQRSNRSQWHLECFASSEAVVVRNLPVRQLHGVNALPADEQAMVHALFNE